MRGAGAARPLLCRTLRRRRGRSSPTICAASSGKGAGPAPARRRSTRWSSGSRGSAMSTTPPSRGRRRLAAARGYGTRRVTQALKAAGIEDEDMAPAREEAESGAWTRPCASPGGGGSALMPRRPSPRSEGRDARQKAAAAMLRAGHGLDLVRRILDASARRCPRSGLLLKRLANRSPIRVKAMLVLIAQQGGTAVSMTSRREQRADDPAPDADGGAAAPRPEDEALIKLPAR